MRRKSNLRKGEAGQVLVIVTIVVALAALIMGPLLRFAYTGYQSAQTREERMLELYAADAGIEDAMYQIKNDLAGIGDLEYGGTAYYPSTPGMNDRDLDVTIDKVWIPKDLPGELAVEEPTEETDYSDILIMVGLSTTARLAAAEDDYEASGWGGGTGWVTDWQASGTVSKGEDGGHSGDRYLKFGDSQGSAERRTSLTGFYRPRLQFYANAGSFEAGDTAQCLVSTAETPGAGDWDTLATWEYGNDTDTYELVNIDIASYGNSSDFWIAFEADLTADTSTVAWDDFESGDWSGGGGWNDAWNRAGGASAAVVSAGGPHSGAYHLRLGGYDGDVNREVLNLSNYDELRLTFYAKRSDNWEWGDRLQLKVSSNELAWTTIKTWYRGDVGTSYQAEDVDLSPWVSESTTWFRIRFDSDMSYANEHFYVDDVEIVGTNDGHFYVDDLWIGDYVDLCTIEIAYTENMGPVYMERLAVWLPPGAVYGGVVEAWGMPNREPDHVVPAFGGGTVLQWDFDPRIDLSEPVGGGGFELPIVRSIRFKLVRTEDDEGISAWLTAYSAAYGGGDPDYVSWDRSYEIYHTISQASHEIWGTNTKVEAYVGKGEIERTGAASYGDYRATGAPLLIDYAGSSRIKEKAIDPLDPDTWVTIGETLYDGRSTISGLPGDAEVVAAWLYWSAFRRFSSSPDPEVEFMYPKECGVEILGEVFAENGDDDLYTDNYPVVLLPQTESVFLDDGVEIVRLNQVEHYLLDRDDGILTIKDDTLEGNVTMYYWAEHWETVTHEAYNRYGMPLDPAVEVSWVQGYGDQGWNYACFRDVTDLVGGTGNGEYAVRDVEATLGADGTIWGEVCYSGWSLIVLYKSDSETAHQFYLYDPIHNADECPFFSGEYNDIEFTLKDFYPPEGMVEGRLTYFVGEGDDHYDYDYIRFKGASQMVYNPLSDPPVNPMNDVMNAKSTTGEAGVDIDTFDITDDVGSDTEANVQFSTDIDVWSLVYVILSFKTSMVPKDDYVFNVAAVTYSYELGTK